MTSIIVFIGFVFVLIGGYYTLNKDLFTANKYLFIGVIILILTCIFGSLWIFIALLILLVYYNNHGLRITECDRIKKILEKE